MRITESQLLNLAKRHLILEFRERGISAMCITEYLPLCAALMYPYRDAEIIPNENQTHGSIAPIIQSIKKFVRKKNGLDNYTLNALRSYFKCKWLPYLDLQEQKRLLNNISLISSIEENGYFSIKGNDMVYEFYLLRAPIPDIRNNYGCESYDNTSLDGSKIQVINEQEEASIESREENVSLDALIDFLKKTFPTNRYPKGLKSFEFFWQYKLNDDQYKDLKDILIDLKLNDHIGILVNQIEGGVYGSVARSVVLFVSEWYKRECTTLNGDQCLDIIGLNSTRSNSVWTNSELSDSLLHQGEGNYQLRQIAMCALGGLPLKYVNETNRFKKFVNKLFEIYIKGDASDEDIEAVVDSFDNNNSVFKKSLKSGSCKKYLIHLVNYLRTGDCKYLPFSIDDLTISPFSDFIRSLKEGYADAISKNYFKSNITIWTYDESETIESEFYVQIGLIKNANVITVSELRELGITVPDNVTSFTIRLKINKKDGTSYNTKECRTYNRIGNHCNDFCGAFGSDIRTDIDFYNIQDIRLLVELDGNEMEIRQLYSVPHYLELFSTDDYYCWTTNTNNKGKKVIFYDSTILTPSGSDDLEIFTKSDDDNSWGWIYQRGDINLQNIDGSIETLSLGATSQILVDFKTSDLKKNIVLTKDGCVNTVINGEEGENMPLLYYAKNNSLTLSCDGKRGQELASLYKIEFKPFNELRYSEWTNTNQPPQGFLTLRIKCRDSSQQKKPWIGNVYFIPKASPIVRRDLQNNFIYFKGENIQYIEGTREQTLDARNRFQDDADNHLDSPTLLFRIGNPQNSVIIDVYRAFPWKQIYNKNEIVKNIISNEDVKPPIAHIFENNIKIKVVDQNGYRESTYQAYKYLDFFEAPRAIVRNAIVEDVSGIFSSYVYLSSYRDINHNVERIRSIEKDNNSIILSVSDKYIDEYVFYYWSGIIGDNPIKLERTQIETRKYRFNIPFEIVGKAVVFQSLRGCNPNLYFRPFYADENLKWQYYIDRYNVVDVKYLIQCYQYAVEHNVYFCIFPALVNLQKREVFTQFVRSYIIKKNYHLSTKDMSDLTRLSKELVMDWFFVERKELFKKLTNDDKSNMRNNMEKLLQRSPIEGGEKAYSQRFINVFLQNTTPFKKSGKSISRKFLKALDDFSYLDGKNHIEKRIVLLTEIVNSRHQLFQEICKILNI